MHSHADVQKSSGAFFRGMGKERCRKRLSRRRMALRGFTGVRPRDVMFNSTAWQIQKRPPEGGFLLPVVLSWSPFRHPDNPVRVTTSNHQPGILPICRAAFSRGVQAIPASGVMPNPVSRRVAMTMRSAVRVTVFSSVKGTHMASVG